MMSRKLAKELLKIARNICSSSNERKLFDDAYKMLVVSDDNLQKSVTNLKEQSKITKDKKTVEYINESIKQMEKISSEMYKLNRMIREIDKRLK